jgi:uncharacterized membrane protein (UPF0127 family)
MARPSFLSGTLRGPARQCSLQLVRSGALLATRVEFALDSESRRRGLLGRDTFDRGAALIIAPCGAIHTFFMRFAIDVVFVARDGHVLKTYTAVPRRRIAFSLTAFAAIELPAGATSGLNVTTGDIVRLVDA